MPLLGSEPTISTGELPQTHDLDHAATGTGKFEVGKNVNKGVFENRN
jgi:hypothetical protein